MVRCPVCGAEFRLELRPTAPFCSDRCRLIDLGRWLDESYALPEPKRRDPDEDGSELDDEE